MWKVRSKRSGLGFAFSRTIGLGDKADDAKFGD